MSLLELFEARRPRSRPPIAAARAVAPWTVAPSGADLCGPLPPKIGGDQGVELSKLSQGVDLSPARLPGGALAPARLS